MSDSVEFQQKLGDANYIADKDLASTLLLMTQLHRPLLVEGDAGVGKTEIAKALSQVFNCPLIRLQCYEGLDVNSAVYEWNYQHQLLTIKLQES
ncbi:MAG: AAA family ATPase, partial [Gammaproteobacteria bacterium]